MTLLEAKEELHELYKAVIEVDARSFEGASRMHEIVGRYLELQRHVDHSIRTLSQRPRSTKGKRRR